MHALCKLSKFCVTRGEENVEPEAALAFLGNCCKWAVVTLGAHGCIAKHGKEVSSCQACVDAGKVWHFSDYHPFTVYLKSI